MKKTKKITRKGCRNVQLVWHQEDEDFGYWAVEKIHPDREAVFITKKEIIEYPTGRRFKEGIIKFPYFNPKNM